MVDDPITRREADALTQALRDNTAAIDKLRLDIDATYVRKDVLEPQLSDLRSDIKSHGDWLLWAQRIVLGAVLLGLLGLVVYQGGVPR
jgi:hypothetical protein